MMRDFKSVRRTSGKNEEIENFPQYPKPSSSATSSLDSSRAPLNAIQEPEISDKGKADRTPAKPKCRIADSTLPLRTPENLSLGFNSRSRYGWAELGEESRVDISSYSNQVSRGVPVGNANIATPRITRTVGRAYSNYSESTSTQNTPTKIVNKPPSSVGFRNKVDVNGGGRLGNFAALYKGIPSSGAPTCVVNTVEVPHYDLKEDPSFWMDHNVQVLIRVRPLNSMERSALGYNRCLKQESAQTVTWIAQPETRFTFDHVASESVDQDTLFRMVGLPMVENCLSGYNSCMFAYGQTGSGKTYTMLGEIEDLEQKPSVHRGMTPRIFEFLFARIQAEEESRSDERLKYNCKCSFLEIYNEQITDLLDPSSTNLMLREDSKNGVYVENLSEFEVQTVSDILRLLTQGSSNRKVAATNMNRESSRSHCVFTCVIESSWEKDSTSNLRFARLNLVDLAGSERQKTSGAEGDRLKEAANINKSLSTLGHVIMVLVDIAHGRPRHIPYRDSRLTFLLQDSLGGNSKTIIVANVSPSMSCAAETFNTLKFAQRAKLIRNNAVVNEDSTGDVQALQRQIRLLKAELAALKSQNVSRCLSFGAISMNGEMSNKSEADQHQQDDLLAFESKGVIRMSTEQLKSLETTLGGALRREQIADVSIRQLQDEIEQLKRLVKKREEENMRTKMTLKFREDRIHRMESMVAGSISSDAYLLEENRALSEEIQLLQAKIDSHPEVTRFATENIRLRNELLRFQEFYEEGERESLLAEVSNLRNQLLKCTTDADSEQQAFTRFSLLPQEAMEGRKENGSFQMELESTLKQLEECRNNLNGCLEENTKLSRELDNLRSMFGKFGFRDCEDLEKNTSGEMPMELCLDDEEDHKEMGQEKPTALLSKSNAEEIIALQLELDIIKTILEEERASKIESEERALRFYRDLEQTREDLSSMANLYEDTNSELKEAKCVIEALESQQVHSVNELEELQKSNDHYKKLLSMKEVTSRRLRDEAPKEEVAETEECPLRVRLNNMQLSLEKAKQRFLNEDEMDQVRRQAEIEAAEVIVCMQEELAILQQQVLDSEIKESEAKKGAMLLEAEVQKLYAVNEENKQLSFLLEAKDREIYALSEEWKMLTCEMEEVLSNGHEAIDDAANELESISEKRVWISEHLSQMVRMLSEKEFHIEELSSCLEDANNRRNDLENMLKSLRGATLVITEAHQQECIEKEALILSMNSELEAKTYEFENMENRLKLAEDNIRSLTLCSTAAFVVVNRLSEVNAEHDDELKLKGSLLSERATNIEASEKQIECLQEDLARLENTCVVLRAQVFEEQKHVSFMQQKLEIMEEEGILQARDKLDELKSGVCSLRSSMDMHSEVEKQNAEIYPEKCMEFSDCSPRECAQEYLCEATPESEGNSKGTCDRDVTVSLLKREVESAIDNLKQVQAEMVKLQSEKEARLIFEKQNKDNVNFLVSQVFNLQAAIDSFEEQSKLKMKTFKDKLQSFEESVMDVGNEWCKAKQLHEHEVEEAEIAVAQKSAEASFILAKFEEAQETLKEADLTINELVIANEAVKIDIERQKIVEKSLLKDKDKLMKEVESLKSINTQSFEILEKQFLELEGIVSEISSSSMEGLVLLAKELSNVRSAALNSTKSLKSWLEEIWSEIIVRDCAVSSLHLCHMGILLEAVTGLNAENGLLQRGLRESNSAMSNLREHNSRSRKELEACSVLKGKLLSDIKNGFDRISKKEREAVDLGKKITSFEQKVSEMQLQEEMMLERSNSIGSQLAVLTKELDLSNQRAVASLLDQEKFMHSEIENFMLLSCSRDLEAFVMAKEMEEMGDGNLVIVEKLVEEVIFAKVDAEMKEQILLDFENERTILVEEAERTRLDLLMKLNKSNSRISELGGVVKSLQDDVKSKNDVVCANQKLKDEVTKITDAKMRLVSQIQSLESEYESLKMDMEALRDEKSLVFQDLAEQKSKCESSSTYIEALNKEASELKNKVADLEAVVLKDKVVIFELHQENEKLQGDINGVREEYKSLGMEMEELRDEKSLVFQDLAEQRTKCESSSTSIEALNKEAAELKNKVADLEAVVLKDKIVIFELHQENEKLQGDINGLREECKSLGTEMEELRDEKSLVFQDLAEQKTKCESSSTSIEALNKEAAELKNKVTDLEAVVLKDKTVIFELHQENEKLQGDINGLREEYESLGMEMEALRNKNSLVLQDLAEERSKRESSSSSIEALNREASELKNKAADLEAVVLTSKGLINNLNEEKQKLQDDVSMLKSENNVVLQKLEDQKSKCESSSTSIDELNKEAVVLKSNIAALETNIVGLQSELKLRNFELSELKDAQSLFLEELDLKDVTLQESVDAVNSLQVENDLLKKSLETAENGENEYFGLSDSRSFELADEMLQRSNWTSKLIEELESANTKCKEMLYENLNLQAELARKDEIQEGLVFDLRLLQESASNVQDQKDELEEMAASLEALEDEIEGITAELDRAVANGETLEAQLKEKTEIISALKLDLVKQTDSVKFLKEENTKLKASAEETLAAKISLEDDLAETRNLNESLEMELEQVNDSIDCLKNDLDRLNIERDELNNEVLDLKEELQKAQDAALKSEAIAVEAQQIAEANDILAHEKDEEVSLLERSVKELECTINVLENKVDIVQGEAERQRLLREELESELHSVKIQMENVRNADADMKLHFDEKKAELEDALKQIEILERDAAQKDAEVSQCKAHISELNLHAEAQANEYKLKYKELEAMAEQVRAEGSSNSSSNQIFNSIPSKFEKNGPKPRGSGSPFKCIGLGMAQQVKSEKDEEYSSLRQRIDELESIVISKQREIFTLNSKLASAESMTHDVIRDLLGVKLDMTSYASLMDSQGDTISGSLRGQFSESQLPDTIKLKEQLNEFVEERHKWLREMEQKQAELISTEIALEKLRQHEQLLRTENDMLKMENSNYRKKSVELEEEVTKLSEQQNLVHRINHHAKIKDENNMLKARNEDLSNKLQQADSVISQVKEELASYRASLGKVPQIDFDEEQLWKDKLKESEEERIKLAEKLLTLCTSILRAAGFKRRVTHSSVTIAEEVLDQLKNKISSMQSELNDLKTKNKIYREQIRMSELRSQQTGMGLKSDENRRSSTPKRTTRASFVSNLDR